MHGFKICAHLLLAFLPVRIPLPMLSLMRLCPSENTSETRRCTPSMSHGAVANA